MNANYFQQAVEDAKRYRDAVVEPQPQNPYVRVTLTAIGPDGVTWVPCGDATFPRCHADIFTRGRLTVTSMDDGAVMRELNPYEWIEAVGYDCYGHISYLLRPEDDRG